MAARNSVARLPGFAMPGEIIDSARWYVMQAKAGNTSALDRAEDLLSIAEELEQVRELTSLDACRN